MEQSETSVVKQQVKEATEERVTGEELSTWPSEPDSTEPEIELDLSQEQKQES